MHKRALWAYPWEYLLFFCKEMYHFPHIYHFSECDYGRQQGKGCYWPARWQRWAMADSCRPRARSKHSKRQQCARAQSRPTLRDRLDCNPPGSSVHGILQARMLEFVAIFYSRGSSPPQGSNLSRPALAGGFFTTAPPGKPQKAALRTTKSDHWSPFCIRANFYPCSSPPLT